MKLVDGTPEEQKEHRRDAQAAGHRASTRQPVKHAGNGTLRTVRNFFARTAFIEKKRSNVRIAQLPDGAIEDEMVQIDERPKREKAGRNNGAE